MKKIRADIILIAALLVAGGIIAAILMLGSKGGDTVIVKVDGQVVKELQLNADAEYVIEGVDGGQNKLIIQDGSAWMSEADCPDKLCVNMGRINRAGQSIVCLPHKVVVEIASSDGSEPEVDVYAN